MHKNNNLERRQGIEGTEAEAKVRKRKKKEFLCRLPPRDMILSIRAASVCLAKNTCQLLDSVNV